MLTCVAYMVTVGGLYHNNHDARITLRDSIRCCVARLILTERKYKPTELNSQLLSILYFL